LDVISIQNDLLNTFRQDFSKYAGHSDRRCLTSVLNSVAMKVGEQIKYAQLAPDFANATIKKAFELLETAKLFTRVHANSSLTLPLGYGASNKKFKTIFIDIGLLSNINGFYADKSIPKNKLMSGFNGKMAEQFVGQELRANQEDELYYWVREQKSSNAEVDYLIVRNQEIIPIEVKSGKAGSLKSLHLLLQSQAQIKKACVLNEDKYGEIPEQKICFRPLVHAASL
jgi:predicted AAA+ superfamily ATPase